MSLTFFVLSLRRHGISRTGAVFSSAPFVGTFLALLIFKEPRGTIAVSLLPSLEFGGGCPNLCEPEPLTVRVVIAASWRKEQIDLVELARLRWVEKWRYERLAEHFGIGRTTVRNFIRDIKAKPSLGGLKARPVTIRGN